MEHLDYQNTYRNAFEGMMIFSIIAIIIWIIILYSVIRYASRSTEVFNNQIYIIRLLKLIAQKNGATDDEINKLLNK